MGIQKDKLTEDQKKEIERLRQFVSRNRLNAHMNSTKWRAAIDAIQAIPGYRAAFRVKRITDANEPPANVWDTAFPGNIPLYNSIEWLELNPHAEPIAVPGARPKRMDFSEALKRELDAAHIPVMESGTGIRIVAHTRQAK